MKTLPFSLVRFHLEFGSIICMYLVIFLTHTINSKCSTNILKTIILKIEFTITRDCYHRPHIFQMDLVSRIPKPHFTTNKSSLSTYFNIFLKFIHLKEQTPSHFFVTVMYFNQFFIKNWNWKNRVQLLVLWDLTFRGLAVFDIEPTFALHSIKTRLFSHK